MVLALKVQVWSKLYIEATIRSARLPARAFSWSWSQKYTFSWSQSRKYIFSWSRSQSQSRIFMNKSLGLACWDWTCSVFVWNLKIWSRRSQNPFLGKSTILSYGFALRFQVWSKLYIEATEGSARVSVSTIFLVSVSISASKIHIVLVSVSVSVSNIHEQESRSRLLRLYLFGLGLACWDYTCSVSVSIVETIPAQSWSRTLKTGLADLCRVVFY